MHITEHQNRGTFCELEDVLFEVVDLGVQPFAGRLPLSIEVAARQVAAIVSMNYTVRVYHWHHLEDEIVAQLKSLFVVAGEKIDDALNDVAGDSLTRMRPSSDENTLLRTTISKIADSEQFDAVASKGTGEQRSMHDALVLLFQPIEGAVELGVGVWVVVREKHLVVVVAEAVVERKREVLLGAALPNLFHCAVAEVMDVGSVAMPPSARMLLLLYAVYEHLHALLEERRALVEVHDVELVLLMRHCTRYPKKEPLGKAVGVDVALHRQVVLFFTPYLLGLLQIAALEVTLELQHAFVRGGQRRH